MCASSHTDCDHLSKSSIRGDHSRATRSVEGVTLEHEAGLALQDQRQSEQPRNRINISRRFIFLILAFDMVG